jgi:polyphosphate kinase 2 (PPK2 family)
MSVAAPTDEEKAHHYLWRFWRHIPRAGYITIYDRSWYGRVLVERVEGFARDNEWRRAYSEINRFEEQLVERGVILLKFWLHISQEEQLARFENRAAVPYKRYKITEEDWRNRESWPKYSDAVNEMVVRTSTKHASWTLVEGNDKPFARIKVLRAVCDALREALQGNQPPISEYVPCGDRPIPTTVHGDAGQTHTAEGETSETDKEVPDKVDQEKETKAKGHKDKGAN